MQKKPQTPKPLSKLSTKPQPKIQGCPQTSLMKPKLQTQPEIKPQLEPKLNPNANFKIPPYIDGGVWRIVFAFVGINKDFLNCRLVCKKWKNYICQNISLFLKLKEYPVVIDNQTQVLQGLMPKIIYFGVNAYFETLKIYIYNVTPFAYELAHMENLLDKALEFKILYQKYLKLIHQKSNNFDQFSDLASIEFPERFLLNSLLAIMYLIINKEDLAKWKTPLDWKYCQQRLSNKDFMKSIKKTTSECINENKIKKFEVHISYCMDYKTDFEGYFKNLARTSLQVLYMVKWGMCLVNYKKIVEKLGKFGKTAVKEWGIKKEALYQTKLLTKLLERESKQPSSTSLSVNSQFNLM